MFSKQHMSVVDWWLFYLIMIIPPINIIVFIMIILSNKTNKSLKSFVWASLLPIIILAVIVLSTGVLVNLFN